MTYGTLSIDLRKAADIRERSWNADASEYRMTMYDACLQATNCDLHKADILHTLLIGSWNESLDWAKRDTAAWKISRLGHRRYNSLEK